MTAVEMREGEKRPLGVVILVVENNVGEGLQMSGGWKPWTLLGKEGKHKISKRRGVVEWEEIDESEAEGAEEEKAYLSGCLDIRK
jgi:hypothetical protein